MTDHPLIDIPGDCRHAAQLGVSERTFRRLGNLIRNTPCSRSISPFAGGCLAVGISSGCNFIAALMVLETMGGDAVVVTVFSDDNKKYLSTDLVREEPVKPDFPSPEVELSSFESYKRVCETCCDPHDCVQIERLAAELPLLPNCVRRPVSRN